MLIYIVIALVLVAAGVGLIFFGKKWAAKAQRMADTPTTPIEQLAPGFREIKGAIKCDENALESPMSRKRCVYFRFKVEEETVRGTGKDRRRSWRTVFDDRRFASCVVDDGTGEADVNLEDADLEVAANSKRERQGYFDSVDRGHADYLQRSFSALASMSFSRSMRYTEEVLEEGEEVYVIGTVSMGEGERPFFSRGDDTFMVSDHSEEALSRTMKFRAYGLYVVSALLFVGAIVSLVIGANTPASP